MQRDMGYAYARHLESLKIIDMESFTTRRLALGLFHFNPHWGADAACSRRHCAEGLGPFLKVVEAHPKWKISFEISGSGLEILARSYASQFDRLAALVSSGQLELISSLYSPSLWVAFPRRDLVRSIEMNLEVLEKLNLPAKRIFFAQEAFFGEGVRTLKQYFDVAICKDDYLNYIYRIDRQRPIWRLGDLRVVVASGHLLRESVCELGKPSVDASGLSYRHKSYIEAAKDSNLASANPMRTGRFGAVEWLWYHCGDGNHFSTISKPANQEISFKDEAWTRWNERILCRLEDGGYQLCNIGDLVSSISPEFDDPLPPLIEGSWNPEASKGILRWMGDCSKPWQNDNRILTTITRARLRLLAAEREGARFADLRGTSVDLFNSAWKKVLEAQGSDYLGWDPSHLAVEAGIQAAEMALSEATGLADALLPWTQAEDNRCPKFAGEIPHHCSLARPTIFGAQGAGGWTQHKPDCWTWEARFRSCEVEFGVEFDMPSSELEFSPSGDETKILTIPLASLKPDVIVLPLSNGLLRLDHDWYVVKDLTTVHVAAQIIRGRQVVRFSIRGARSGRDYLWTFHFVKGTAGRAVEVANSINGA